MKAKKERWLMVTVAVLEWTVLNGVAIAAESGICEKVAALADAGTIEYHWQDQVDINNDGSLENLDLVGDGITDFEVYRNRNEPSASSPIWDSLGGPFWQFLTIEDITYRVQCRDPGCWAPARLFFTDAKNDTTEVCHFRQQYQEMVAAGGTLCHSLIGDNAKKYIRAHPLRLEYGNRLPEFHYAREQVKVDFDNDGIDEELIRVEINNESRSPCSYYYFDLLDTGVEMEGLVGKRDLLLRLQQISDPKHDVYPTKRCSGNDAGWLELDGAVLFESKYRGQQPDAISQFHDVMKMHSDGTVERICQYTVLQKTKVVR